MDCSHSASMSFYTISSIPPYYYYSSFCRPFFSHTCIKWETVVASHSPVRDSTNYCLKRLNKGMWAGLCMSLYHRRFPSLLSPWDFFVWGYWTVGVKKNGSTTSKCTNNWMLYLPNRKKRQHGTIVIKSISCGWKTENLLEQWPVRICLVKNVFFLHFGTNNDSFCESIERRERVSIIKTNIKYFIPNRNRTIKLLHKLFWTFGKWMNSSKKSNMGSQSIPNGWVDVQFYSNARLGCFLSYRTIDDFFQHVRLFFCLQYVMILPIQVQFRQFAQSGDAPHTRSTKWWNIGVSSFMWHTGRWLEPSSFSLYQFVSPVPSIFPFWNQLTCRQGRYLLWEEFTGRWRRDDCVRAKNSGTCNRGSTCWLCILNAFLWSGEIAFKQHPCPQAFNGGTYAWIVPQLARSHRWSKQEKSGARQPEHGTNDLQKVSHSATNP